MRRLRLAAASAAVVASAAFAGISPAVAHASTTSLVATHASSGAAAPDFEYTSYEGTYSTNRACAALGTEYIEAGAWQYSCNREPEGWALYVTWLIV
jgi:hypothetical protein